MLHIEIDLVCFVIVGIVLYEVLRDIDRSIETRHLVIFASFSLAFFVSDMIWCGFEGGYLPFNLPFAWVINIVYFSLTGLMGYCWFRYSEAVQHNQRLESPVVAFFSAFPMMVLIVVALSSPWTGWLFSIDDAGTYSRGPLYSIQPLIMLIYASFTAIKAMYLLSKVDSYADRRRYQTVASFVIIPFFCGALQIVFYEFALLYPGIAISLLWVYIDLQHQQVSLDPLTQVNNRSQLMKQYGSNIRRDSEKMYLLMIDADDFKHINDKYGHLEGDKALVRIASALKLSARGRNCFIARYGGDEFVAICNTSDPADIDRFAADIESNLDELNRKEGTEYEVKVSVGYAKWGPETNTMRDLVAAADVALYAVKQKRKAHQAS